MTGMDDLVTWLRVQLDDDDRVARGALHTDAVRPGQWMTEHHNSEHHSEPDRCHIAEDRSGNYWTVANEVYIPVAEHMSRHDPARVLAEVDAKRRLIDEAIRLMRYDGEFQFLELLALPYADQPGYREEWRP